MFIRNMSRERLYNGIMRVDVRIKTTKYAKNRKR